MTFILSQVLQGLAMKYAVDHWRRSRPRCMGTLYWQLNDCWPAASWSSIDWQGNWKALQYFAKRFYAPLRISIVESAEDETGCIWLVNDEGKPFSGNIDWSLITTAGEIVARGMEDVFDVPPFSSSLLKQIDLKGSLEERRMILYLRLLEGTREVSTDTAFFTRPRFLEIEDPAVMWTLIPGCEKESSQIIFTVKKPAFWVFFKFPGTRNCYSDNFFHLYPGYEKKVDIPIPFETIKDSTPRIYSLYDSIK